MKNTIRSSILIILSIVTTGVNADWYTGTINRIQVGYDKQLIVYLDSDNEHECGSKRVDFFDTSAPGFKLVFAALLSYEAQNKSVQFAIEDCSGVNGLFRIIESI